MAINTARHRKQRARIVRVILPNAIRRFLEKNEDYGFTNDDFGQKAQVIDISRKYKKLKSAIWDEEPLSGESVEEVAEDLIGHLLILLEMRAVDQPGHGANCPSFTSGNWLHVYEHAMKGFFHDLREEGGQSSG